MNTEKKKVHHTEYCKIWRKNNHEKVMKSNHKYEEKNPYRNDLRRIGNIINRDNQKCAWCGITNSEHEIKWHSGLSIHHVDGNGRNYCIKNNNPKN